VRESSIARVLKTHHVRRLDAAEVLRRLQQMPLAVAPGVTEAMVAHIRTVAARLRLVNRQVKEANRRLDALTAKLAEEETASGQERE
jgi:CRP-like cAMP-binding protein